MYKIVKFRTFDIVNHASGGWRTLSLRDFDDWFKRNNKYVFILTAKVYGTNSNVDDDWSSAKYILIDAWDWLQMGFYPKIDSTIKELAKLYPQKYRLTKKGVWSRRLDLLPN